MDPKNHLLLEVTLVTPEGILFEGNAQSVILPGTKGTFEILPHHKPLLSRLLKGEVSIDGRQFPVQRGVVRVGLNRLVAIVEAVSQ